MTNRECLKTEIVLLPATRHIGLGADPSLPERVEREKLGKIKIGTRDPDGKGRGRGRRHEDSYPLSEHELVMFMHIHGDVD